MFATSEVTVNSSVMNVNRTHSRIKKSIINNYAVEKKVNKGYSKQIKLELNVNTL